MCPGLLGNLPQPLNCNQFLCLPCLTLNSSIAEMVPAYNRFSINICWMTRCMNLLIHSGWQYELLKILLESNFQISILIKLFIIFDLKIIFLISSLNWPINSLPPQFHASLWSLTKQSTFLGWEVIAFLNDLKSFGIVLYLLFKGV